MAAVILKIAEEKAIVIAIWRYHFLMITAKVTVALSCGEDGFVCKGS